MIATLRAGLRTVQGVARIVAEARLGLIAAGVAFFSMLAVFPGIAAVIALFGYFADPHVVLAQVQLLADFLPPDAFGIVQTEVQALVAANVSTLGWASAISTLAALWSARAGVAALIEGVNATHAGDDRGNVHHLLASALFTVILVGVALVALAAAIFVPILLAIVPLGPFFALAAGIAKWATSLGVVLFGVGLAYRYGPNRPDFRSPWLSPGLLLAVALWAAASIGFSYYISNFSSYNRVYGSIGAVIALLMWFYISAYVILLGAALTAELERHRGPASEG
jgi:membrane protein